MTGRHKFSDLEAKMTPDRRARIARIAEKLANEIDLRSPGPEPLRQALLQLLRAHPNGLTRQEIRQKLGVSGDTTGEQSISDALSALAAAQRILARDRKFIPAE
jgi:hypothetical protein